MESLSCYLVFLCVFGFFQFICCTAHDELNRAEILCIQQSQKETALGRWLECLKSAEPDYPATDLLEYSEMSSMESPISGDANDMISIVDSSSPEGPYGWISQVLTGELSNEQQSAVIEHLNEDELPAVEEAVKDTNNSISIGNTDFSLNHVEESSQTFALNPPSDLQTDQDTDADAAPHPSEQRSTVSYAWLQNLGLLLLIKFLHKISGRWRKSNCNDRHWYDAENSCIQEGNMEAACNPKETERFDESLSKNNNKNGYIPPLGSPLGSAVAAVLAEVLLTSCNCELHVSVDKLNMLFRTAFSDILAPVIGDSECFKLLDDFMASFRGIYTTICRIHNASLEHLELSQKKSWHTSVKCGGLNPIGKYCTTGLQDASHQKFIKNVQSDAHLGTSNLNEHPDVSENIVSSKMSQDAGANIVDGSQCPTLNRRTNVVPVLSEKLENLTLVDEGDSSSSCKIDNWVNNSCSLDEDIIADEIEQVKSHCSNNDLAEDVIPGVTRNGVSSILMHRIISTEWKENVLLADSSDGANKVACNVEYGTSSISDNVLPKVGGPLGIVALAGECYRQESPDYQSSFLSVLERYVMAQEHHNQIKSVEVAHLIRQHALEEEKVQLTSISNDLMKENIELSKSRASFKESRILEEKAISTYANFNNTCADELAAGLVIMLVSFGFGVSKYSFTLLNDLVALCQPSVVKESRRSIGFGVDWLLNSVDSVNGKLQAFVCHVTVTGRIFIGSFFVAVVAASLLRRSVINSSQTMPATIVIIMLGGVCGFVGKVSVDSVGGNGIRWLVIWEMFCLQHALVTCFTPFFYNLLHGAPSNAKERRIIPFWLRKLAFHFVMLVLLPVLAGQLPFGSFRQVTNELISSSIQVLSSLKHFML